MREAQHTCLYNRGAQTIYTVAYDVDNRPTIPTSITYNIVDLWQSEDSPDRLITDGASATIDPYSKVTDAEAGRGTADRRRIQLDAAHGSPEVGKRYLIADTENAEVFVLDRLDTSANDLYARHDLQHNYASGATVKGIEIPATVPADLTDTEENLIDHRHFAVDWTFVGVKSKTGASTSYVREIIRLERHRVTIPVTPEDLLQTWQALKNVGGRFDLRQECAAAESMIRDELEANNVWPDERILGSTGKNAAKFYALYNLALQMGDSMDTQRQEYWGRYHFWLTRLLTGQVPAGTVMMHRENDAAPAGIPERYETRFGRA